MEDYMLEGMGSWLSFVVLLIACYIGVWYVPSQIGAGLPIMMKIIISVVITPICYFIVGMYENKG